MNGRDAYCLFLKIFSFALKPDVSFEGQIHGS